MQIKIHHDNRTGKFAQFIFMSVLSILAMNRAEPRVQAKAAEESEKEKKNNKKY